MPAHSAAGTSGASLVLRGVGTDFAAPRLETMHRSDTKVSATTESLIIFQTSQGVEVRATALRLTKHLVVFEVYAPSAILRMSEALTEFKILIDELPVYAGRAVVTGLVNTGTLLVCEANLADGWLPLARPPALAKDPKRRESSGRLW